MIGISDRARQELKRILSEKVDNPLAGWRLSLADEGQLVLALDIETPGDQVVEYDGSKVLMVEPLLAEGLKGLTIDIEDTPEGLKLAVISDS